MKDIGSRRGWFVPPFSTGYRTPEFRSHAPGYPGQEPATGNFCHGNIPPLPFRRLSAPRHRGHLSNHADPPLPSPDLIFPLCRTTRCSVLVPGGVPRDPPVIRSGKEGFFSWPTTPTAKRELWQRGRGAARKSWLAPIYMTHYPREPAHILTCQ